MYFMEAFPREVLANCDKMKKRKYSFKYDDFNFASLKTHLCQYLTGEGPYIGGAETESFTKEYRKTEEYRKAVEKATREGLDPDACYDGFSRFSSTFADLLADMLRVHRENHGREYGGISTEIESAVEFFAHFFEDYRIKWIANEERWFQRMSASMERCSPGLSLLGFSPFISQRNAQVGNMGRFFDTLGFKNAGNGDFSEFRKRFRVRRALVALRAVIYFQFMYKKSIEAQCHPDKVRGRLEDECKQMGEEVGLTP